MIIDTANPANRGSDVEEGGQDWSGRVQFKA